MFYSKSRICQVSGLLSHRLNNLKLYRKQIPGMSVLEILIVMTIITMLLVGGTLSYGSFRRYNLASESMRFIKEMLRIAKYQTYTIRAAPGEALVGTGVNMLRLANGGWRFRLVKIAIPTSSLGEYVEYPVGNIPSAYIHATSFEDIEQIDTLPEFGLILRLGTTNVSCVDFYVIFEVPLGTVHYYCLSGSNLVPMTRSSSLILGFKPLSNKFLYVTPWSEIYMR